MPLFASPGVTIRHGLMPAINDLIQSLMAEKAPSLSHLVQIVYLILDHLTDLSVQAETEVRDQILRMAKILNEDPRARAPTLVSSNSNRRPRRI